EFRRVLIRPSRLTIFETQIEPRDAPIQEYKKPFNNPYAAPFANTKTNNGRNGKKASINGNKIPGSGPRFLYFSRKSNMYSKNSFASCIFISINKITGVTPWKVLSMSI